LIQTQMEIEPETNSQRRAHYRAPLAVFAHACRSALYGLTH
jgi:hypothetical protein